jgi:glycosyltransferase involved in cell wall biosynthesis
MKNICFVATIPEVINAFLSHSILESSKKWDVSVITNPVGIHSLDHLDIELIPVSIQRKPEIFRDILTFLNFFLLFKKRKFDLVHSIMPKTGFLAMFAAKLAGVPIRVHTFTGQNWSTMSGIRRAFYKLMDKFIVFNATHIFIDSPSQRQFLINEGILYHKQGIVIGSGSICGVDLSRFQPNDSIKKSIREKLRIPFNSTVILYVGRLNKEKGVLDLILAFKELCLENNSVYLLLVGAPEDISASEIFVKSGVFRDRVIILGYTLQPEHYFTASDIFCLPSYREGFGQAIMEAAASGLPAIASKIYGVTDAVVDNVTGLLFQPGKVDQLANSLLFLIQNPDQAKFMGLQASNRAKLLFSNTEITSELISFYSKFDE